MRYLFYWLLFLGSFLQLRGQEYCRYCYTVSRNSFSETLTLSNVYSVHQDRRYFKINQQCYDNRELAELNRQKEIESATGYAITHITETGSGCD